MLRNEDEQRQLSLELSWVLQGEHSIKTSFGWEKADFLTSSASPVDRSFTLRRKPSCTPKWTKSIQRHPKENRRATWNAKKPFIWSTLFSLQGGKDHNRSNRYSECTQRYTQESHANSQKWLRVAEHLHNRYCHLFNIILSIILIILLPIRSTDFHCICINHKNLHQNSLNICWPEHKLLLVRKENWTITSNILNHYSSTSFPSV